MSHPGSSPGISPLGDGFIDDEDVHAADVEKNLEDQTSDDTHSIEEASAPDEITGRATKTEESLTTLFGNESQEHITDGFRGGSDDDDDVSPPDSDPLIAAPD